MEPIKISRDSWHYKLVKLFYSSSDVQDICSYRKAIFVSMLLVAICALIASLFIFVIGTYLGMVAGIVTAVFSSYPVIDLVLLAPITFALLLGFSFYMDIVRGGRYKKKKDSAVKKMYHSWKEKYCSPVEFE